ncbi:hypothetical protein [Nonomuraea rubra]|uniref:Uncharacterized protein n=3 Tax=Nonomuraea rubra TaxID=46180 RepID=A0A7X0U659_9ACTN|nr:hypothetical protein [Nonomuraea rubra]MBB6556185.1 hypothetical protein [Nonomuraea rubra]
MSQRTYDLERLCAGACMNGYRRKVRTYEAAYVVYRADHQQWRSDAAAWHAPLVWPEEPAEPDEPRLPYRVEGEPVYCPDCMYGLKSKLSKLDGAACVYLREADGFRGQTDQAKVSSKGSEPPSLSPTIDDIDELDGWLRDWKASYLGAETMARQGMLADSITLGASWLVARAERILGHADLALLFGEEIARWYGRLVRYDPSDVVVEPLRAARCPECKGLTLERKVGEDKVTCRRRTCERVLKWSEYQEMAEEVRKTRKAS